MRRGILIRLTSTNPIITLCVFLNTRSRKGNTIRCVFARRRRVFLFITLETNNTLLGIGNTPRRLNTTILRRPIYIRVTCNTTPNLRNIVIGIGNTVPNTRMTSIYHGTTIISIRINFTPNMNNFTTRGRLRRLGIYANATINTGIISRHTIHTQRTRLRRSRFHAKNRFCPNLRNRTKNIHHTLRIRRRDRITIYLYNRLRTTNILNTINTRNRPNNNINVYFNNSPIHLRKNGNHFHFLTRANKGRYTENQNNNRFHATPIHFTKTIRQKRNRHNFIRIRSIPNKKQRKVSYGNVFFYRATASRRPVLPFVSGQVGLFVSATCSDNDSLSASSTGPLAVVTQTSSSLDPQSVEWGATSSLVQPVLTS